MAGQPVSQGSSQPLTFHSNIGLLHAPQDLTEEQIEKIRSVFMLFDKDGEGTITIHVLGAVMRALGQNPTEAEMEDIIAEIDADGNGIIEFPEFVDLMSRRPWGQQGTDEELRKAFTVFDHEQNGQLNMAELRLALTTMGEQLTDRDVDKMLRQFNADGDGNVKYEGMKFNADGDGNVKYEDFVKLMMQE